MKKKNKGKVKGKAAAAADPGDGATVEDGSAEMQVEASCGTSVRGESDAIGSGSVDLTARLSKLEELLSSSKVSGSCACASEIQSLRLEITDVKDDHKSFLEKQSCLESAVLELKAGLQDLSSQPDLSQHAQTDEGAKLEKLGAVVDELRTQYERLRSKIDQADIDGMITSNAVQSKDENDPEEPDDGTGTTTEDRTSLEKEKANVDSSSPKSLDQVDKVTGPDGANVVAGSVQEGTTETPVPFSDAPILGAPIRAISFMARFVTGADLVKSSRDTHWRNYRSILDRFKAMTTSLTMDEP